MGTYDANPDVTKHVFFVNGTEFTPTCSNGECNLPYEVKSEMYVTYNAANSIGTGTATELAVPGRFERFTFLFHKKLQITIKMCTKIKEVGAIINS